MPDVAEVSELSRQNARLLRRLARERLARKEAEYLMEERARELWQANRKLERLADDLERRIEDRTRELEAARSLAVRQAKTDDLTGLANRLCYNLALEALTKPRSGTLEPFALFYIDIDRFKTVNDMFGHEAGDVVLQSVARRLRSVCGSAELVARLGGDEFAVLITGDCRRERLAAVADEVIASLNQPSFWRNRRLDLGASLGIAVFPEHGRTEDMLQRRADLALYQAKAERGCWCFYHEQIGLEHERQQALTVEVVQAMLAGDFEPWFQPIVEPMSRCVLGAEVLTRWRHPSRGILGPADFLPVLEQRRMMDQLFEHVLRSTAPLLKRWWGRGALKSLSVNVSPSQFRSAGFAETVLGLLYELDLPPRGLTIEVTEEVITNDIDLVRAQLGMLSQHGVQLALDDFGVGYANISLLHHLSFDSLKVDRSLTVGVSGENRVGAVLRSVVGLAHALDMSVVAEGIEDAEQAMTLAELGFRAQQGYHFGRPAPADAFERRLLESRSMAEP